MVFIYYGNYKHKDKFWLRKDFFLTVRAVKGDKLSTTSQGPLEKLLGKRCLNSAGLAALSTSPDICMQITCPQLFLLLSKIQISEPHIPQMLSASGTLGIVFIYFNCLNNCDALSNLETGLLDNVFQSYLCCISYLVTKIKTLWLLLHNQND